MNQNEIWKPVKGYEGFYEINQLGVIRTVERIVSCGGSTRRVLSKIKKQSINAYGYLYSRLYKANVGKNILIHKALMEAFVPNPENKPCIDHINTIRTDNRLENLRWVSHKENTQNPLTIKHITDACSTEDCKELQRQTKARIKSANYNPKRIYQYSLDGKFIRDYCSQSEAIRAMGLCSRHCISNINVALDNNRKSAYGYMWTTTPKTISKYIKPHGKYVPVKEVDENGYTIKIWESLKDAALSIGVNSANLSKFIRKGWRYKGKIFQYCNDPLPNK